MRFASLSRWILLGASAFPDWLVRRIVDDVQTLIIHVILTKKIPLLWSLTPLTITTVLIMGIGMWLLFSLWPQLLGFGPSAVAILANSFLHAALLL